jgi:hemophore-related protein
MKRIAAVIATGAVTALGLGFAVPALADTKSKAAPPPLTSTQQQAIQDFLGQHPRLGQRLATRAQAWETFLAANPDLKAELAKVAAEPVDQRRAELRAYLKAHPTDRAALKAYRAGQKALHQAPLKSNPASTLVS